jgi:ATP-binding cassette subfamily B protein
VKVSGVEDGPSPLQGLSASSWWPTVSRVVVGIGARASPLSIALLAVVSLLAAVVPVGSAIATSNTIDAVATEHASGARSVVVLWAGALALVGLVGMVLPQIRNLTGANLRRAVALAAEARLIVAVNAWPGIAPFETPTWLDRLRLAREAARSAIASVLTTLLSLVQALVTIATFAVTLLVVNDVLAALVLLTLLPAIAAQTQISKRQTKLQWVTSPLVRQEEAFRAVQTDPSSVKELRLFALGDFFRDHMLAAIRRRQLSERQQERRGAALQSSLGVLAAIVTGGGLVWTAEAVSSGTLPIGDIALFTMAVLGIQSASTTLTMAVGGCYRDLHLARHFYTVLAAKPALSGATGGGGHVAALCRGIEIEDLWFRYGDAHPWVLQGVNLTIPAGTSAGIVGVNGGGKSTLVKLLLRMYDPVRGTIRWDGVDVRELDIAELRRRMTAVFQDYTAYDLTAAENIGVGDLPRAGDEPSIAAMARRVGMDERIRALPEGYETLLSRILRTDKGSNRKTGITLSGGQWQRIAIARALMRGSAELVVLDEPTSGLDARGEAEVMEGISGRWSGRTCVIVSQRLGIVRRADQIVVLRDGRVCECGTHLSLMEHDGEYRRLFVQQASAYVDAEVVTTLVRGEPAAG